MSATVATVSDGKVFSTEPHILIGKRDGSDGMTVDSGGLCVRAHTRLRYCARITSKVYRHAVATVAVSYEKSATVPNWLTVAYRRYRRIAGGAS
jgi:hypothetical protein